MLNVGGEGMLLKIPLQVCAEILNVKNAPTILCAIVNRQKFSSREIMSMTGVNEKAVWKLLNILLRAGIIEKEGRFYRCTSAVSGNHLIVNVRDARTRWLFKPKLLYDVLLYVCFYNKPLSKIASDLGVSYRTVKRLLRRLRALGLVQGFQVNPVLVLQPSSPLELIPRAEHRQVVHEFLQLIPHMADCTLILYGDASSGLETTMLKFLVLFPATIRPEELTNMMERFVIAAGNVTETHGLTIDLAFAPKDVWLEQKLGMVLVDNALMKQALQGICLAGKTPEEGDYFELHNSACPVSHTRLKELLTKGYIKHDGLRYVYTEKALRTMRKKAPTLIKETQTSVFGKTVRLLEVRRPQEVIGLEDKT